MAGDLKSGNFDEPIASINMTPFVDIILVVLIIFMVTTPIIMKPSLKVDLPEAASGEKTDPSPFNVSVTQTGELLLNGKTISREQLADNAKQFAQENSSAQAVIAADRTIPHGDVVTLIDIIKTAGIHKFAISIEKQ